MCSHGTRVHRLNLRWPWWGERPREPGNLRRLIPLPNNKRYIKLGSSYARR